MNKYVSLGIWVCGLELLGALSGLVTQDSVGTWYVALNRSPLTPPNYVFGIVWTLLYAMIATSGWLIWQSNHEGLFQVKCLFLIQLIFNLSWTPLFFYFHLTGVSLVWMAVIILMTLYLIVKLIKVVQWASMLLIPYLLWLLLACQLNYYIWMYN